MKRDAVRLASAYLKLWKLLDLFFPGHQWLEISEESVEGVLAEVQRLSNDDLSWAAQEEGKLQEDVQRALGLLSQKVSATWMLEAARLRDRFQEEAFSAVEEIRENLALEDG